MLVVALACLAPARAEEPLPPLSFAFAHYVGSGIYGVRGRTVQIYSLPFAVNVRSAEGRRLGLTVTVPATIGFFDFKPSDVIEIGFPDHVGTLSVVPGLRLDVRATATWTVSPFVEAGLAKDFEGGSVVEIEGLGVRSEVRIGSGERVFRIGHRALVSSSRDRGTGERDTYGEFRSGFEVAQPTGGRVRGHDVEVAAFVTSYLYFKPPDDFLVRLATPESGETIRVQWEAGLTFGARPRAKWWKVPLPRFGLSYRFGDGPETIRVVFGAAF